MNIGVVIVNWNSGQYLAAAVNSVLTQKHRAHQILVMDNASTDDSLAAIESLEHRGVQIHRSSSNVGFARASNLGVEQLQDCDWVALLNPDAVADPNWLARLAEGVNKYPDAHSFASRMMSLDAPEVMDGAGDCYHISGFAWRRFHGRPKEAVEADKDAPVFGPCGGAAFYRRSSFVACGGFDESYFCYCEDVDLAFRMQLAGYPSWYLNDAVVYHKGGGTQTDGGRLASYYGHRNLVWTWYKNMPLALLIPLLPVHILGQLVASVYKSMQRRDLVVLSAKLNAIAHLAPVLKKRKEIQRLRTLPARDLWFLMSKVISR